MTGPLRSVNELERVRQELKVRPRPAVAIRVCSTGCRAAGALELCEALDREVSSRGLGDRVQVVRTGCHGLCSGAPALVIDPKGIFYQGATPEDASEILEATALGGRVIKRLCWSAGGQVVSRLRRIPFYRNQMRLVLKHCGVVDPQSIEDCLFHGGYGAAARVLTSTSPEEVIREVREAGLRGRGGAGFPTGSKWEFCRKAPGEEKYVICNADEGDPGAFMDRALLEGDPHLVVEGMLIGAYAIGAHRGVIYVRAEYPIAVEHVAIALTQARQLGLLGSNILGTGFVFDIEVRQGAGAFVCGEETALIASVEGKRGMPRTRPPFPATAGLYGKPTNINNVETWANVPRIIEQGARAYAKIGSEGSKGTKIFALAGKVNNTGLVEVPMGATLRQIIFDIGGGIPRGRKFKAAQIGGPSGGCVAARHLDHPLDYDSLKEIGAIMGSGGLIVLDEATCMVDIARFFTDFVQKESCGKCVPCRVGTRRMLEILTRITSGQGELADIDRLVRLGNIVKEASLCGLGQTAPNPVLSTIRYFRSEYEAHIVEKRCPANSCEALAATACGSACPAHINIPEYVALVGEGRFADALEVIRRRNPFAAVCGRACEHPCELFCRRGDVDEPVAIRHLKRFVADRVTHPGQPQTWVGKRTGRVAVIGSGPAGLTAAYFLALLGREVKVFEARDVLGGSLVLAIPRYRLPRDAVERDIQYILRAGIEVETNHPVKSLEELRRAGFDAIFIATGAQRDLKLNILGEQLPGVSDALGFLGRVNRGEVTELRGATVVVGGGNAALDSARTALRLGASPVTVLYRRTRADMPAIPKEVEEAMREGIEFRFLVAPVAIEGDGRVRVVRCTEMQLGEADEDGRRRPVPVSGSEWFLAADHVVAAVGQTAELDYVAADGHVVVSQGRLVVDPVTQRCGESTVFAGGDVVTGPATVVEAVAAGQRAARAIDIFLGGTGELPPDKGFAPRGKPQESDEVAPRQTVRSLPAVRRRRGFLEVVKGYSRRTACAEARRCLRCDLER